MDSLDSLEERRREVKKKLTGMKGAKGMAGNRYPDRQRWAKQIFTTENTESTEVFRDLLNAKVAKIPLINGQ